AQAAPVRDASVPRVSDAITATIGEPHIADAVISGHTGDETVAETAAPDPIGPTPRPYGAPAIVEDSPAFPMAAFIIPEGTARLRCGVGEPAVRTVTADTGDPGETTGARLMPASADVRVPDLVDTAPLSVREDQDRRPRSASMREQRAHDV